jgi:hypothetical protein
MDPSLPAQKFSLSKWFRSGIIIIAAVLLVGLAISFVLRSTNPAPEPAFAWLNAAQFVHSGRPGKIKLLYWKVLNFTAPVWQHFRSSKPNIQISSKILTIRGVESARLSVGTAIGTNESGARAWLLSASELDELRQRLKGVDEIEIVASPTISTSDGMQAMLFTGQTYAPTFTPVGITVDVIPRIASHQLKLAINTTYSESVNATNGSYVRTNLSAACRVLVPNAGGVLIAASDQKDKSGTNYWLLLSATAVDGMGKTIKL